MTILCISGEIGSGKTTIAKILAQNLDFDFLSTGELYRTIANKLDKTVLELNQIAEKDDLIDTRINDELVKLNSSSKRCVVDSRLAWFFIPKSLKIYLTVAPLTAAKRVHLDKNRKNEKIMMSLEDQVKVIEDRRRLEINRFKKKFGIDCADLNNYDIVIDTTYLDATETFQKIINHAQFKNWKTKN